MRVRAGIAAVLVLASIAWAEDWSKSFDIKGIPDVVLRVNDGHIIVKTWNQPRVQATLIATGYTRNDYDVEPSQSGDRVQITIRKRHRQFTWDWTQRTFRLEVIMPAKGTLDAETGDGHMEITDLSGRIQAHTGDGHISGRDLEGAVNVRTGDGHINLSRLKGTLNAHTGDGHVTIGGRFDELNVETGDGHVSANVDSGSVMKSNWNVRTRDGRVSVELPGNFAGEVAAHTGDGRIRTDLHGAGATERDRHSGRRDFRTRFGSGGHLFTIRTGDGGIQLSQR